MAKRLKKKEVEDCPKCKKGTLVLTRYKIRKLPNQEYTCDNCGHVVEGEDLLVKTLGSYGVLHNII